MDWATVLCLFFNRFAKKFKIYENKKMFFINFQQSMGRQTIQLPFQNRHSLCITKIKKWTSALYVNIQNSSVKNDAKTNFFAAQK